MKGARRYQKLLITATCATLSLAGSPIACHRHEAEPADADFEPVAIVTEISTNRIYIGEPILLQFRVQHPESASVQLLSQSHSEEILLRDQKRSVHPLGKGRTETRITLELTSLQLGEHSLTNYVVTCALDDGGKIEKAVPPQFFWVESAISKTNQELRPPRDLADWPSRIPRWIWVLPLIAALAAIAGWAIGRFLSKPRTILQMLPPEPPHEIALRALRALKAKGWIEQGNVEPFYIELSAIVRHYIENRFGIRAPELTTEEFMHEAARSPELSSAQQELVKGFLEQADLVKFARFRPECAEMQHAFTAAEQLVLETIPVVPAAESGGVTS